MNVFGQNWNFVDSLPSNVIITVQNMIIQLFIILTVIHCIIFFLFESHVYTEWMYEKGSRKTDEESIKNNNMNNSKYNTSPSKEEVSIETSYLYIGCFVIKIRVYSWWTFTSTYVTPSLISNSYISYSVTVPRTVCMSDRWIKSCFIIIILIVI